MSLITISLLALQLTVGCKKEKSLEPVCKTSTGSTTELNQDFELIWSVRDSRGFTSYGTVVTPTSVVYFIDPPGGGGDDIIALDKTTGDTLWIKKAQSSTNLQQVVNNTVCYRGASDKLFCLDITTGNELWSFNGNNGYIADYIYANNNIYTYVWGEGGVQGDSTRLFSINPNTGSSKLEFTVYKSKRQGYRQRPKGMIYYQHSNGNEIIFSQVSSTTNVGNSRGEYYAIDITGDSMYWDLGDFFYDGDINSKGIGSPPVLIGNNNVFVNNGWIYNASLNLETKTINWKTQVPKDYRTGGGLMVECGGKVFQSFGNNYQFNIINAQDGSFYKNLQNLGFDNWAPAMKKYNNHVYVASTDYFLKLNSSGDIVKKYYERELLSKELGGTVQTFDIDPITGYIYATVGSWLVCMKEK